MIPILIWLTDQQGDEHLVNASVIASMHRSAGTTYIDATFPVDGYWFHAKETPEQIKGQVLEAVRILNSVGVA